MKYVIYELVNPDFLQKTEADGYYLKTISRSVLQLLDEDGVEGEHSSMESAMSEIEKNTDKLKWKSLVVLPVITINWEGEIS